MNDQVKTNAELIEEISRLNQRIRGLEYSVSENKRMEEALRNSEIKYRQIFESIEDIYYSTDIAGTIENVSPSVFNIAGWTPDELIGKSATDIYADPSDREKLMSVLLQHSYVRDFEITLKDKQGMLRPVSVSARLLFDVYGAPRGLAGTVRDIAERKQAEGKLRESEERYRILFEGINDAVFVHDLGEGGLPGRFLQVNDVACRRLGYSREELLSLNPRDITLPEEYERIASKRTDLISQGEILFETIHITKDGLKIPVESNIRQFQYLGRQAALSISRDITKRKRAEEALREIEEHHRTEQALRRAKEAAETANRAKSAFLANMSHELRTPLGAVIGFSEVLNKQYFGPLNDKQMEYVQDIAESGQHLLDLINDILDLAKIEAGKDDLYYAPVSLPELLVNSLSLLREKARRHDLEVRIEGEQSLAGITVTADARKLKQVLYNLLSNAMKFTPDGGRIIVRAGVVDEITPGEKGTGRSIEVSVADTGIGLTPGDQERIFEEFHQVYDPITGKKPGTGLGLTLTRRIIGMHGGRIWVESAGLGKGSAFIFRIPCAPPQL